MAKKQGPPSGDTGRPGESAQPGGLADALRALDEATRALAAASGRTVQTTPASHQSPAHPAPLDSAPPASGGGQGKAPPAAAPAPDATEARAFYERLEQTGQLVDVTEDMDLSQLSPRVTHVRRPDGTVERVGFSASPYGKR